jgi:serine protease Do
MKTRTVTVASFFSVAMAATLLGALYTTQVRHAKPAHAATAAEPAPVAEAPQVPLRSPAGALGLETFRDVARAVNAGIVNISTSKVVRLPRNRDPFHDLGDGSDLLERFFGPGPQREGGREQRQTQASLGSGFVIDRDGYILTNRHVIQGADEVSVSFPGGRGKRYQAKIVGQDARTDVALIKIDASASLTPLPLGDSEKLDVGEWVMAVGNPFGLGDNSVTVGVVSYMGRDIPLEGPTAQTSVQMIQTDAAINPGNSGGPLINTRGEVVGINTMIVSSGGSSAGVGFSVPINVAKDILPQLRARGKVTRGWMGVTISGMTEDLAATYGLEEAKGAVVGSVTPGSPAEKAGLQPEDVVLSADGHTIENNGDLSRYIAGKTPGTTVRLELLRGKAREAVNVTLGTFPDASSSERSADESGRSKLGMALRDLTPQAAERLNLPRGTRGVVVMDVEASEAAEDAGLQRGDVIVSVNGQAVDGVDAFERAVEQARTDGRVRLRVRRDEGYFVGVLRVK